MRGRGGDGPSTRQRWSGSGRRTPPCRRLRRSGWPSRPPTCSGPPVAARRPGSTCRGLDRCDRGRPGGAHRRRAGDVHLRAPRRRDAAARPDPARRAAAAHDHPRRRGHRARHRVDQLPQRAAARVGARDGRVHRRRRGGHRDPDQRARRPLRRLPQLLRLARLRHPAADRARAGRRRTSRCATCASTTPALLAKTVAEITDDRGVGRRARSTGSTGSRSRPTSST